MGWYPLDACSAVEYLNLVGVLENARGVRSVRIGAKNAVFRIDTADDVWILKQFGASDRDLASFRREVAVSSANSIPCSVLARHVDDEWRAIVYPSVGEILLDLLREPEPSADADEITHEVATALGSIATVDTFAQSVVPAIAAWLIDGPEVGALSLSQIRVLASLVALDEIQEAASDLRSRWGDYQDEVVLHGDMKAEHVIVDRRDAMQVRLIDWEYLRRGPRGWDHAGLAQSVLAHALAGNCEWDPCIKVIQALFQGADLRQTDIALFTGMRLLQTAVEWEGDGARISELAGSLCQAGVNIICDGDALFRLLDTP